MSTTTQISYIEGTQKVTFPLDWEVIKLDAHPYYKKVSGHNLKSMDFMAIHEDWGLVLIELKDYIRGSKPPDDLDDVIEKKAADSVRLIRAVQRHLDKQWYYKLFFKWLKWKWAYPGEWDIWLKANVCIDEGRIIKIADIRTD